VNDSSEDFDSVNMTLINDVYMKLTDQTVPSFYVAAAGSRQPMCECQCRSTMVEMNGLLMRHNYSAQWECL
jgi:hypothetical protein